jgi:hypothetical protein
MKGKLVSIYCGSDIPVHVVKTTERYLYVARADGAPWYYGKTMRIRRSDFTEFKHRGRSLFVFQPDIKEER